MKLKDEEWCRKWIKNFMTYIAFFFKFLLNDTTIFIKFRVLWQPLDKSTTFILIFFPGKLILRVFQQTAMSSFSQKLPLGTVNCSALHNNVEKFLWYFLLEIFISEWNHTIIRWSMCLLEDCTMRTLLAVLRLLDRGI